MEVDAPKAPFPLKRLLRESLSQIAWGLVWFAGIVPVNMILDHRKQRREKSLATS